MFLLSLNAALEHQRTFISLSVRQNMTLSCDVSRNNRQMKSSNHPHATVAHCGKGLTAGTAEQNSAGFFCNSYRTESPSHLEPNQLFLLTYLHLPWLKEFQYSCNCFSLLNKNSQIFPMVVIMIKAYPEVRRIVHWISEK